MHTPSTAARVRGRRSGGGRSAGARLARSSGSTDNDKENGNGGVPAVPRLATQGALEKYLAQNPVKGSHSSQRPAGPKGTKAGAGSPKRRRAANGGRGPHVSATANTLLQQGHDPTSPSFAAAPAPSVPEDLALHSPFAGYRKAAAELDKFRAASERTDALILNSPIKKKPRKKKKGGGGGGGGGKPKKKGKVERWIDEARRGEITYNGLTLEKAEEIGITPRSFVMRADELRKRQEKQKRDQKRFLDRNKKMLDDLANKNKRRKSKDDSARRSERAAREKRREKALRGKEVKGRLYHNLGLKFVKKHNNDARLVDPECVLALPPELVHYALGFLAARHLATLAQACSHFQRHVQQSLRGDFLERFGGPLPLSLKNRQLLAMADRAKLRLASDAGAMALWAARHTYPSLITTLLADPRTREHVLGVRELREKGHGDSVLHVAARRPHCGGTVAELLDAGMPAHARFPNTLCSQHTRTHC